MCFWCELMIGLEHSRLQGIGDEQRFTCIRYLQVVPSYTPFLQRTFKQTRRAPCILCEKAPSNQAQCRRRLLTSNVRVLAAERHQQDHSPASCLYIALQQLAAHVNAGVEAGICRMRSWLVDAVGAATWMQVLQMAMKLVDAGLFAAK
jgi:hypothetical protein